jgi:hypothetical protein
MRCLARQTSDQMTCHACGLVWDMNDPEPPTCNQGVRVGTLQFTNSVTGRIPIADVPNPPSENLPRSALVVGEAIDITQVRVVEDAATMNRRLIKELLSEKMEKEHG